MPTPPSVPRQPCCAQIRGVLQDADQAAQDLAEDDLAAAAGPHETSWLMALQVGPARGRPDRASATRHRAFAMLVPVSPSGTGYTFSRLIPAAAPSGCRE